MTNAERENFSALMANLFSPPEMEIARDIHSGKINDLIRGCLCSSDKDIRRLDFLPALADPEILWQELHNEYDRLFSGNGGNSISLVESVYKPWTEDATCGLSFARAKGLLMGDAALHMLALLHQYGLSLPEAFKVCPDHLVIELEFLSFLYSRENEENVKIFIRDHLDWLPSLGEQFHIFKPHPLYASALTALNLFLKQERARLEIEKDGEKSLHGKVAQGLSPGSDLSDRWLPEKRSGSPFWQSG